MPSGQLWKRSCSLVTMLTELCVKGRFVCAGAECVSTGRCG